MENEDSKHKEYKNEDIEVKPLNNKAIIFMRNFSYTLISNLISLIVSTLVVIILPRAIGIEEYGYWQLSLFYFSYVGFMHFGWNDGIYLRYGGKEYKELNKQLFFSQFYMLVAFQVIIAAMIYILCNRFITDDGKIFIIKTTAICMIVVNVRYMLLFILQGTNRIKEYARITMLDRIIYIFLIVILLMLEVKDYKLLILSDISAKFLSLIFAMYYCKDIVFNKFSQFTLNFKEALENISVGVKLMFANIASMLIIGTVRFGIERTWDVSIFGKVSLTLSISNLMMLFINAVGIVLFPILKRASIEKLPSVYLLMRNVLMTTLLGALCVYYPLKIILIEWLPKYSDSLMYMVLVFPMFLYEGKMALLINTYLKTLRREKLILKINVISFSLSIISTIITTLVFENLNLAVLSIVILLAFRSVLAEMYISKILGISIIRDILLELVMTIIFVFSGWYFYSWIGILVYLGFYISYLIIKRREINNTIMSIKKLIKI